MNPPLAPDWLAPDRCLACRRLRPGTESARLCLRCRGALAERQADPSPPAGIRTFWAGAVYAGPALGLVASIKRDGIAAAADVGAELIAEGTGELGSPPPVLVPIPASPLRGLGRRLDPAAALAASLGRCLGLTTDPLLVRRDLRRQRGRTRAERRADPPRIQVRRGAAGRAPAHVLLVDDVLTTGATLSAAADALLGAGTTRVDGAVLARALRPGNPA